MPGRNLPTHGNIWGGGVLGGQPRHCFCTNAWCSLSVTAEFLVLLILAPFDTNSWIWHNNASGGG